MTILSTSLVIINKISGDCIALQRYRTQVDKCLTHIGPSIQRLAQHIISALVDEKNVETAIPEVLDYATLTETEFRVKQIPTIFTSVQRLTPSLEWSFDSVHRIIGDSCNYVSAEIAASISRMLTNIPELQKHAVPKFSCSLFNFGDNLTLMQISACVLGEFKTLDDRFYHSLRTLIKLPQTTSAIHDCIMTALAKHAVRLRRKPETAEFFGKLTIALNLEVQQRVEEFGLLLATELLDEVLAPKPSSLARETSLRSRRRIF
jgi:hypothetical protein